MSYDPMISWGRMFRWAASARVTATMNERFVTSDVPAKVLV